MKGILLVNLGTPDSTKVSDVRKYLREFLSDKRVIDIAAPLRWMLVNLIIAPFRAPKSAREYRKLFNENGSPLKYYGERITKKVQVHLGEDYKVSFAMRYQSPSIKNALAELQHCQSIHVIPLFPHYASATTGSVIDKVMEIVRKWQIIPEMTFTTQFFDHELLNETLADNAQVLMKENDFEHFIFSYHGIPERHIRKGSVNGYCQLGTCCQTLVEDNRYCYRAQCFAQSRILAAKLGLDESQYTVTFQSRLGKDPWIKPYTDVVLEELAHHGIKKVLAFSPAFVSDCLETTIEVGEEFKEEFEAAGGELLKLVPSLNESDKWVSCLVNLALKPYQEVTPA